jgi:hypothetical protein
MPRPLLPGAPGGVRDPAKDFLRKAVLLRLSNLPQRQDFA